MQESLAVKGDNTYKLPHMGKDKLANKGELPISIQCDPAVIAIAREALDGRDKEVPTAAPTAPTTTGLITGGTTGVVAAI